MEDRAYYKQIPYRLEIVQDPVTLVFHAEYPDLPGCTASGQTMEEAIRNAEEHKAQMLMGNCTGVDTENHADNIQKFYSTHEHDAIDRYMSDRVPLKVAAYIRETVPRNGLRSPLDLQYQLYESVITGHPGWKLAGIYTDKGNAMQLKNRPGLQQLLRDCEAGKIDIILCKNMKRLFLDISEVIELLQHLADYAPPIGVFFEAENTFSLTAEGFD